MSTRRIVGWLGVATTLGMTLQACIAVPVRERPRYERRAYGYGGSGYVEPGVDVREARSQCLHVARDYRGYRSVRAGAVDQVGPDSARVRLFMSRPFGREYAVDCRYDARTGAAYVP